MSPQVLDQLLADLTAAISANEAAAKRRARARNEFAIAMTITAVETDRANRAMLRIRETLEKLKVEE